MTTFSKTTAQASLRAGATLVLPTSAFNPVWRSAPRAPMTIGIRLLSVSDIERAKSAGAREAYQMFPRPEDAELRMDAFQDLLVRWLVARGTCDPDDATRPFDLWREAPEDLIAEALSVEGVKACWDAIDKLAMETSPVQKEIADEELAELFAIAPEAFAKLVPARAQRLRRLLGACLDELREVVNIAEVAV